ncbi:Bug family tripartite tricarboxylate transporter substrate binding protein [Marinimicrococcus flavescens]|uniref:Tripartite tricarboxylate transporter substrate binding protein n=1 Tax=Marinimicrococcus flavescens TaxID=3031815 RepID=A0AAP3V0E2_9PROT|nr:tripartite tricarboxylate transporter substrate binding protein [Marinimicrococcus flavescens]
MKKLLLGAAAIAVTVFGQAAAEAADYPWKPEKPLTIIVPWAAGGSTDQVTRVVAGEIEKALGQKVVIVNQPGASGSIGTKNALEAPKDGYTWAAGAAGDLGTYPVLGMLDTTLDDWHLFLDVANVSVVGVNPDTSWKTTQDLLDAMKAKPGSVPVATAGLSSAGHNAMELIAQATGVTYKHVTYDGGNPAVIATVSGETEVTTQLAVEQAEMIRAGRIRPLSVVGDTGLELEGHGTIPPITDTVEGIKAATNYFGIWAPKGVPEEVVQTMEAVWKNEIASSEALKKYAANRGALFTPYYGEEAKERAMGMVSSNAWTLFEGGKAKESPEKFGIPRP